MKVVIVGGVAGGASTAARLRRVDEEAEIVMLERGPYVSFANCGLPYYLSRTIDEREKLLVTTPEKLKDLLNIDARPNSEVVAIDRESKTVLVRELPEGREYRESYDKLVLAPGAEPIVPPLPGVDLEGVFVLHNIPELDALDGYIRARQVKRAVVIGGGFIGLEVAENLSESGIHVSLVEMLNQVMAPVDYEMASEVHEHLALHGINLVLGDGLKAIEKVENADSLKVRTTSGKELEADLVVLAIGVRPNTKLAKESGIEVTQRGHIVTNEHMQTSDPDIYAVGDAVQVKSAITGLPTTLALAGPASRQGRVAADNIAGRNMTFKGVRGTSVVKVFDLTVAATGMNTRQLQQAGIAFNSVSTHNYNHASYYPGASLIHLKLLFGPEGQIYGAQAVGTTGVEKRIDVIATAMHGNLTVFDLEDLELSYAPPFGSSRDPVNIVGFTAANALRGDSPVRHWDEAAELTGEDWYRLDVRETEELAVGALADAHNIPLHELRERLAELPKDKKILVNCASGQRSYFATRLLRQKGFDAYNLSGGYKTYRLGTAAPAEPKLMEVKPVMNIEKEEETALSGNQYHLDACGLQCPGPILKLYTKVKEMADGDQVTVRATDLGFARDVEAWAKSTGNRLLSLETKAGEITAVVQKGTSEVAQLNPVQAPKHTAGQDLTMVVFSGDLDKAIAAFIIANGFASLGQQATLFFTFWGLNVLKKPQAPALKKTFIEKMFGWMLPRGANKLKLSQMHMMGAGTAMIKGIMRRYNVDSLPEMIKTAQANGVKLLACQMSMELMGIRQEELIDGVELAGVATMAAAASNSNTHYFI
jgi:NADPH-dependent 2,4-dienoyl-CoA reductase/sulfur reductase-like enzyme/peroxiredoxin family protein/rhodanese-related sulfurtransferase/TusA-related sulfurtransferase